MIGIITFHRAANYGTVLQTYALQKTLDKLNVENEVIDYRCKYIENIYNPFPTIGIKHTKTFILQVLRILPRLRVRIVFNKFLKEYVRMSTKIGRTKLKDISEKYDAIITGSDQVWNLALTDADLAYVLEFTSDNTRKLSYAASLGPEKIELQYKKILAPYLKKFEYISVREETAFQQVLEMTGKNATIDADPTVLLKLDEWNEIADASNLKYENFIFVYTMQPSEILYDIAEKISAEQKCLIYSISMVDNSRKLGINVRGLKVTDFVWMIKNAKYVITNSFHGLMFSIRYHKEFFWAYQNGNHMSNPRFDMLTKLYKIDKRRCDNVNDYKNCVKMDWNETEEVLRNQAEISKRHLISMIRK